MPIFRGRSPGILGGSPASRAPRAVYFDDSFEVFVKWNVRCEELRDLTDLKRVT